MDRRQAPLVLRIEVLVGNSSAICEDFLLKLTKTKEVKEWRN